ncbi:hypothetical protein, partial [Pseudomonas sp. FW305-BF6]|uniref:hypothetical protein n=1 Tax=Pseudomonas sp. FW305-BF6 TaxID=2070673 RepID=UPI0013049E66
RSSEVSGPARSAAAYEAGAKLVITVNNGPQELSEYVGTNTGDTQVAVATISGTECQELIEAAKNGNVRLNVKGNPDTEYV